MENCCEDKVKYKKTPRTKEDVSKLKNRLSRIQGQIEGVKKMQEENKIKHIGALRKGKWVVVINDDN